MHCSILHVYNFPVTQCQRIFRHDSLFVIMRKANTRAQQKETEAMQVLGPSLQEALKWLSAAGENVLFWGQMLRRELCWNLVNSHIHYAAPHLPSSGVTLKAPQWSSSRAEEEKKACLLDGNYFGTLGIHFPYLWTLHRRFWGLSCSTGSLND